MKKFLPFLFLILFGCSNTNSNNATQIDSSTDTQIDQSVDAKSDPQDKDVQSDQSPDLSKDQNSDTGADASFTFAGKQYLTVFEKLDWESAAAEAVKLDGYLVEINSQEEQAAIFNQILKFSDRFEESIAPDGGGFPHFWIGANDLASEGDWVWDGNNDAMNVAQFWQGTQNGSVIGGLYNNWGNEPSNGAGGQDAGGIVPVDWTNGVAGTWNDVKETNTLFFIIEKN